MQALLVHGMGRTPLSMMRLARALRQDGIETGQFGYIAARQSVDQIVDRLRKRIQEIAGREYVLIGHSLGGLLLRIAVSGLPADVPPPAAMVLLAAPGKAPRLARRFQHRLWYRLLNGDAGALLASETRMAAVPGPTVPTTVVAGTGGPRGRWSPFATELNDGIVAVSEVELAGAEALLTVNRLHPVIMNDARVRALIRARCANSPASVP